MANLKYQIMKYKTTVYLVGKDHAIGEVEANSIKELKNKGRLYASNYTARRGRAILEDQRTGQLWRINFP